MFLLSAIETHRNRRVRTRILISVLYFRIINVDTPHLDGLHLLSHRSGVVFIKEMSPREQVTKVSLGAS